MHTSIGINLGFGFILLFVDSDICILAFFFFFFCLSNYLNWQKRTNEIMDLPFLLSFHEAVNAGGMDVYTDILGPSGAVNVLVTVLV